MAKTSLVRLGRQRECVAVPTRHALCPNWWTHRASWGEGGAQFGQTCDTQNDEKRVFFLSFLLKNDYCVTNTLFIINSYGGWICHLRGFLSNVNAQYAPLSSLSLSLFFVDFDKLILKINTNVYSYRLIWDQRMPNGHVKLNLIRVVLSSPPFYSSLLSSSVVVPTNLSSFFFSIPSSWER